MINTYFKRASVILIMLLGIVSYSIAEPGFNRHDRIAKRLNMTTEQSEQFKAVMREAKKGKMEQHEQRKSITELLDSGNIEGAAEMAAKLARERVYAKAQIKQKLAEFLTQEQVEQFKDMRRHRGHKGCHGYRHGNKASPKTKANDSEDNS